jgi:hypothetical protein
MDEIIPGWTRLNDVGDYNKWNEINNADYPSQPNVYPCIGQVIFGSDGETGYDYLFPKDIELIFTTISARIKGN